VVPIPINVSFDAYDDEVDIDYDFPSMFENVQTNQDVDLNTLHDVIINVIERWGFGLEVEHQTYTQVAQLEAILNASSMYHPQCIIPFIVQHMHCVLCQMPFHSLLYVMFNLKHCMPLH
jgi:hypothetical protein